MQRLEPVGQLRRGIGVLGIHVEQVHADLDADADVSRIADVRADPFQDGQDSLLVAALEGVTDGAAVPQGKEQGKSAERRVVGGGTVDDTVQRGGVPRVSEVGLPGALLFAAVTAAARGVVGGNDDVGALADEVKAVLCRGAALAFLFLGVKGVAAAGNEGFHFTLAFPLAVRFGASETSPQGEHAGLHADGEVAVRRRCGIAVAGGRGDDLDGEDGGRIFDAVDDVPAGRLKDLDVAFEATRDDAPPVRGETQRGDRLLVVGDEPQRPRGDEI